ncbi:basic membrane protein A [Lachnospiraceae bacterium]|nr:basic membrane protein A [Lachnospiraceae bacterium]
MRKLISTALALLMAVSLTACGSGESGRGASADDGEMKVAMIADFADITDMSFNQTSYEACKKWAAANGKEFTYYRAPGDSTADRVAMVDKAVADGYNVIVAPGYAFAGMVIEESALYHDVKFIILDMSAGDLLSDALGDKYDYNPDNWNVKDYYYADNVYCAIYAEEKAGYMTGQYAVKSGHKKLGYLGGMALPAVMRFGYGFVKGADDAAAELGLTDVEVNYAYGNQFNGDADITAAMDTWYHNGTEVVFACGGSIYTSVAEAAAKMDGKVIGVDVDQKETIDGTYGEGMTVTSAMKGLEATINTLLDSIRDDRFEDYAGKIETLGLVSENPEENYVQLPIESTQWNEGFSEEDYRTLVADIVNGKIEVSSDVSAPEPPAEHVKVNYQGNLK